MLSEFTPYVMETSHPYGTGKMMPQSHYRCEGCDAEYVWTGLSKKLRMLDCGDGPLDSSREVPA